MKPPIEFISENNQKNLLVFIHGFTSSSDTWVNSEGKALPEMLKEESVIGDSFDIAYFNYFTELMDLRKFRFTAGLVRTLFGSESRTKKNIGIASISDHFKSSMEIYCSEYENVILIAHSMGGLVSKAYILKELEDLDNTNVKLFLSLAVPHKGSDWASIGAKLFKRNPQVIDLKPMSGLLDKLNGDWVQQKKRLPKTIYYYGQFDDIVKESNAISYQVEKQLRVACNYDHFGICKPESKESIVYKGIKKELSGFLKELEFEEDMKKKIFVDEGNFDDELFVLKLLIADIHDHLLADSKQSFFDAEYMLKAIISQGYTLDDLSELYGNLERLYKLNFVKFVEGDIKSSNQLIIKIFEEIIDRDKNFLKVSIPLITTNKKTGMLQQLANKMDKDIWWAKNQSIKNIEDFRKARDGNA